MVVGGGLDALSLCEIALRQPLRGFLSKQPTGLFTLHRVQVTDLNGATKKGAFRLPVVYGGRRGT